MQADNVGAAEGEGSLKLRKDRESNILGCESKLIIPRIHITKILQFLDCSGMAMAHDDNHFYWELLIHNNSNLNPGWKPRLYFTIFCLEPPLHVLWSLCSVVQCTLWNDFFLNLVECPQNIQLLIWDHSCWVIRLLCDVCRLKFLFHYTTFFSSQRLNKLVQSHYSLDCVNFISNICFFHLFYPKTQEFVGFFTLHFICITFLWFLNSVFIGCNFRQTKGFA